MKKTTFIAAMALCSALGASAQSASWTFYNPDNVKHSGYQTDHTIVVKVRTAPTLADFNNDGKLEMIYGGQNNGEWDYYWQEKDGEWKWDWGWNGNYNNSGYVIGFNGWDNNPERLDGKSDYWSFETDTYGIPLGTNNFYRWLDFNNDGNLDLIMFAKRDYDNRGYEGDYYALIYQNGGADANYKFTKVDKAPFNVTENVPNFNPNDGYFDGDKDYLNRNNRGISFGDVNGDGIVDFVSQNQAGLKVWIGKGDGSFECVQTIAENNYREGDVKLADLDGDGILDMVASGWAWGIDYVNFFKGNGDGTFEMKNPEDKRNIRSSGVAVADFNNDGKLDVLIMGYTDSDNNGEGGWISDLYLGGGDFTFTRQGNIISDYIDGCVCYAFDVDNDGNIDLVANHGTNLKWWRGNGDGTFQGTGYCNNKQNDQVSGGGFAFGDVYNRNMLDQAICLRGWNPGGESGDRAFIGIIPGRTGDDGNGALNQAPTAPTNVKAVRIGTKVLLSWDAATDDKTPAQSLLYNIYVKYGDVVRTLVPANLEGGSLKVVQDMQTLPMQTKYALTVPADVATSELEIGVQAIDGVFAPSTFAKAEIAAPTLTIVGEFPFCGGWHDADSNEETVLTQDAADENIFTLVVDDFETDARAYSYRLRAEKQWGIYALPTVGNAVYEFTEAGSYKLTFTANLAEGTLTLDATNNETTGISTAERTAAGAQRTTFNLQGQRVTSAQKGIYIQAGKKVLK